MVSKGPAIWLLVLVCYGSGESRTKRIGLLPQFSSQPPPTPYPIWKIHRYTGLQLQPVELPHKDNPIETETPTVVNPPDYTVSEADEPEEEDPYSSGRLGTILSFIPGGLTGLLSLSTGSGRNEEDTGGEEGRMAEDRLGLIGLKKDILTSVLQNKKELLLALKRDAIQLAIRKAQAKKSWIKNLLFGTGYPGYYNTYYYPKKSSILSYLPFVGNWFGSGTQLPEVNLPNVPNLIALKDPPQLPVIDLHGNYKFPYQSETYVKVDYPDKNKPDIQHQVPSTSYGVPEKPVPVPSTLYGVPEKPVPVPSTSYGVPEKPVAVPYLPYYENNPPSFSHPSLESAMTTVFPQIVAPEVHVPQYSQPPLLEPAYPYLASNPNPLESYPYASGDYYDTAQSEILSVKEGRVQRHLVEPKKQSKSNGPEDRLDSESNDESSANADNIEKNTETFEES